MCEPALGLWQRTQAITQGRRLMAKLHPMKVTKADGFDPSTPAGFDAAVAQLARLPWSRGSEERRMS